MRRPAGCSPDRLRRGWCSYGQKSGPERRSWRPWRLRPLDFPACLLTIQPLELLDERLDSRGHFAPLRLLVALLALERGHLLKESRHVLALKLAFHVLQPLGELVSLALQA